MSGATNPADLVDRTADEALLDTDREELPETDRAAAPAPAARGGRLVLGVGITLTGLTLLGGVALIAIAAVAAVAGSFGALDIAAAVAGLLLVSTHWGWVHTAEATATAIGRRANRSRADRHRDWLAAIKPYTRWSITTTVTGDGAIAIVRRRHTPVPAGDRRFTFATEVELEELHDADAPAAEIAERAETLRHAAAADTARERQRWELAHDVYERSVLDEGDEQQRLAARRAASQALSERINSNLREPPLIE